MPSFLAKRSDSPSGDQVSEYAGRWGLKVARRVSRVLSACTVKSDEPRRNAITGAVGDQTGLESRGSLVRGVRTPVPTSTIESESSATTSWEASGDQSTSHQESHAASLRVRTRGGPVTFVDT